MRLPPETRRQIAALWELEAEWLVRYAMVRTGEDQSAAEDLMQTAFLATAVQSLSMVTRLNPRAPHEATNASTHMVWNCHGSVVSGSCGTAPPAMTCSRASATGTPSSHLNGQGSTLKTSMPPREPTRTAGTGYGQVTGATLVREQVPAPDGWTKTFTDPRLCAAIVDRLTFNGTIIETGTDSYRLASTRARAEESAKAS